MRSCSLGSAISPVLANLFMHYAFDMWLEREFPTVEFERYADDAIARLHRVANGLPRALNNAATAALIAAAAAGKDLVDDACAKKAVAELTRD